MKKPDILNDKKQQQTLEQDGFVKISVFTEAEMKPLLDCYEKYEAQHTFTEGGFHHTTHQTNNQQLIDEVNDELCSILTPRLESLFCNYEVLASNFIIKEPGEETEFIPHQDWTLLDETRFYSANLWFPLHDLTDNNGMLRFLRGSHKLVRNLRMPPAYPGLFSNIMHLVYPQLTSVPLKLGEGVVFDCGVLHGSFANTSGECRKNVITGIFSKDAPFRFYYNTQKGNPPMVEEYHIKPEEFLTFAVGTRPSGRIPDRTFPYQFPQVTAEEFKKFYTGSVLEALS